MKFKTALICVIGTVLLITSNVYSASPTTDESFSRYQEDADMRILRESHRLFTFSYGGWISPVIIDEQIGDVELATSTISTRLWLRTVLWRNSFIYVRGKYIFQSTVVEEGMDGEDDDHLVDLDVGFIKLANGDNTLQLFLGRKFFVIGTGLVLNGRGDGAELKFYSSYIDLKILCSYTGLLKKDTNPYNLSNRDLADGARRVFAGGTLTKEFWNQKLYLFGLAQIDLAEEEDDNKTRYQSQYFGVGLQGVLFSSLRYYGEFTYQTGESYLSGTDTLENIRAHAGMFGLNYYASIAFNPVLIMQYAYASGDPDRHNYKSPTGNTADEDNGFLYFGSYLGGYALRPLLGNIHILRAGFSVTPFYNSRYVTLRRMNILVKYSYYMKYNTEAYINYGEAPFDDRDIGHGIDTAVRWRIYYDFALFVNYALFIPGNAYAANEEKRQLVMGGFTLIF